MTGVARWPQSPLPPREASRPSQGSQASGRPIPSLHLCAPPCRLLPNPQVPCRAGAAHTSRRVTPQGVSTCRALCLGAHLPRYPGALLPAPREIYSVARHTLPSFPKGPGLVWMESFSREAAKAFLKTSPGAGHFLVLDPWAQAPHAARPVCTPPPTSPTGGAGGQRGPHPALGEATPEKQASSRSPPSARCLFQTRGGGLGCPAAGQQEQGWRRGRRAA